VNDQSLTAFTSLTYTCAVVCDDADMGQYTSSLRRIRLGCPDERVDRTITLDMLTSVYDLYPYVYSRFPLHERSPKPDVNIAKKVYLHCCNIENLEVDCIVNAANASLQPGAGVCDAIFAKGGQELRDQVKGKGLISGVHVCVTKGGGNLHVRHVIHAVGPDCRKTSTGRGYQPTSKEKGELYDLYVSCMAQCIVHGDKQIAFPPISTGFYKYPKRLALMVALQAIRSELIKYAEPQAVILVAYTKTDYDKMLPLVISFCRPYSGAPPTAAGTASG